MKIIKYVMRVEVNQGTKENPQVEEIFVPVSLTWSEANEEIAKAEAYNGEYIVEDEEQSKEEKIAELKVQLTATDYKIIKCSEYLLAGEEMPYDVAALHAERQAIRDEINRLEREA